MVCTLPLPSSPNPHHSIKLYYKKWLRQGLMHPPSPNVNAERDMTSVYGSKTYRTDLESTLTDTSERQAPPSSAVFCSNALLLVFTAGVSNGTGERRLTASGGR